MKNHSLKLLLLLAVLLLVGETLSKISPENKNHDLFGRRRRKRRRAKAQEREEEERKRLEEENNALSILTGEKPTIDSTGVQPSGIEEVEDIEPVSTSSEVEPSASVESSNSGEITEIESSDSAESSEETPVESSSEAQPSSSEEPVESSSEVQPSSSEEPAESSSEVQPSSSEQPAESKESTIEESSEAVNSSGEEASSSEVSPSPSTSESPEEPVESSNESPEEPVESSNKSPEESSEDSSKDSGEEAESSVESSTEQPQEINSIKLEDTESVYRCLTHWYSIYSKFELLVASNYGDFTQIVEIFTKLNDLPTACANFEDNLKTESRLCKEVVFRFRGTIDQVPWDFFKFGKSYAINRLGECKALLELAGERCTRPDLANEKEDNVDPTEIDDIKSE